MTPDPTATGASRYVAFLPCTLSAADLAGDFISSVLVTWGADGLPADSQAALCELLTNTVDNSSSSTLRIVLERLPDNVVHIHIDSPSDGRASTTLTRHASHPSRWTRLPGSGGTARALHHSVGGRDGHGRLRNPGEGSFG